jgi:oxaloacetate decarboxylase gamma subunit
MENIELGLLLMVVGMATVFAILLLIIYLGKGLIAIVDKMSPEEVVMPKRPLVQTPFRPAANISGGTAAAIVSAISIVTDGKGKVTKIEKR